VEPLASYGSPDGGDRQRIYSLGLGLLSVVGIIAWFLATDTTSLQPARSDDNVNAWVFSEEFMKRQLDSPSTASFCPYDKAKVSSITSAGMETYTVAGCVDVPNVSGATFRRDFICKLHKHGDLWHLDKITMVAG
jgi:hypothetical protein